MPYFSNGTEGEPWRARNCLKGMRAGIRGCAHNIQEAPGCPIIAVSMRFTPRHMPLDEVDYLSMDIWEVMGNAWERYKCAQHEPGRPQTMANTHAHGVAEGIKAVLEALVPTGKDGFAKDCPFFKEER